MSKLLKHFTFILVTGKLSQMGTCGIAGNYLSTSMAYWSFVCCCLPSTRNKGNEDSDGIEKEYSSVECTILQ